ncbi:MAG: vWA domain-containing protein [Bdellovibrionota bacterium]
MSNRLYLNLSLLILIALCTARCSDVNLSKIAPSTSNAVSKGSFCTYNPEEKLAYTNYLFIIDYSGSNGQTDSKKTRVKKALAFYEEKKAMPYVRWGSIGFDDDPKAMIYETNNQEPIFTNDPTIINPGIERMKKESHSGSTNYSDTIDMATEAIALDMAQNKRDDNYIVFFLTDGEPNRGDTSTAGLVRRVQNLVGLKAGKVFFSSAYYGGQGDPNKLRAMAEAGNGKFLEFNNTDTLNFDELTPPGPQKEAWILKNDAFFVYNLNSAICERAGYKYAADSDADGVCDLDEVFYGLDPVRRSTPQKNAEGVLVNKGYSDYFILAEIQGKTILPNCNDPKLLEDLDNDLLNECEENIVANQTPIGTEYKDIVWKHGNPKDPDTDNDGIIDGLDAVVFRKHFGWALDNRVDKDWDNEGTSAFRQVQQHRNPLEPDANSKGYDVNIAPIGIDNGRSCFTYQQSSLPLYDVLDVKDADVHPKARRKSNQNTVMVYFMQTKFKDPNGKGMYMHSFQNLYVDKTYNGAVGTAAGLQVKDSVFSLYEIYKKIDE